MKSGWLTSLLLVLALLLSVPCFAATYYVSNCGTVGSDSNSGTSTSTPWLTVAKVNASAFVPGDAVLFNRGCTWREQLAIPSSGTSGNLITFGAYGTGIAPILTGTDLVTGTWTQDTTAPVDSENYSTSTVSNYWTTKGGTAVASPVFSTEPESWQFTAGTAAFVGNAGTNANYTEFISRFYLSSASTMTTGQGSVVKVEGTAWNGVNQVSTWITGSSAQWKISIGRSSPGTTFNISSNTWYWVRMVVNANNGAGLDSAQLYVVAGAASYPPAWGSAVSSLSGLTLSSPNNSNLWYGTNGGFNSTQLQENFADTFVYNSNSTVNPPRWYASVATQPLTVEFNTTWGGAPQTASSSVTSANQWFWGANTLYVYSTANPNTSYTSPGIQAGARQYTIVRNGKNYFQLIGLMSDGPNSQATNPAGVFIGTTGPGDGGTESSGVVLDQMEFRNGPQEGVWLDSVGGVLSNSYAHEQGNMCFDFDTGSNMTGINLTCKNALYGSVPGSVNTSIANLTLVNFACISGITNNCVTLTKGTGYVVRGDPTKVGGCDLSNSTFNGVYLDGTTVTGATIEFCRIRNNGDSGVRMGSGTETNVVVQSNVISGNTNAGLYDLSGQLSAKAYNNTFYNNGRGLWVSGAGTAIDFRNNALQANTVEAQVDATVNQTLTVDYNDWYHPAGGTPFNWKGTTSAFAAWQTNSGLDVHSLSVDPKFRDPVNGDFSLQAGSPAIDVGVNLGSPYNLGLAGGSFQWATANQNSFGSGWEIGAFVFGNGATVVVCPTGVGRVVIYPNSPSTGTTVVIGSCN